MKHERVAFYIGAGAQVEKLTLVTRDIERISRASLSLRLHNVSVPGASTMPDVHTFLAHCTRRFGTANPTRMDNVFWHHMVRTGERAVDARREFEPDRDSTVEDPVWCFNRFGPSRTLLPDGTVVCIGGEHEDYYDPDFCIYNDVIVIGPGTRISIFGYPREIFAPTDFHTADLRGNRIIIVGGLGYIEDRGGPTPVFSLDLANYSISRLHPTGPSPGWIYEHKSQLLDSGRVLRIHGGRRIEEGPAQKSVANTRAVDLLLTEMIWKPAPAPAPEEPSDISLPYPWKAISRIRERSYLIDELRQQVPIDHPLFAVNVDPVAEDGSGKLLFRLEDGSGRFACVELELMEDRHAALPKPPTKFYKASRRSFALRRAADQEPGAKAGAVAFSRVCSMRVDPTAPFLSTPGQSRRA